MSDHDELGAGGGASLALLVVFVLAVTVALSRCQMRAQIAEECKDYGKFEDKRIGAAWYECKRLSSETSSDSAQKEQP